MLSRIKKIIEQVASLNEEKQFRFNPEWGDDEDYDFGKANTEQEFLPRDNEEYFECSICGAYWLSTTLSYCDNCGTMCCPECIKKTMSDDHVCVNCLYHFFDADIDAPDSSIVWNISTYGDEDDDDDEDDDFVGGNTGLSWDPKRPSYSPAAWNKFTPQWIKELPARKCGGCGKELEGHKDICDGCYKPYCDECVYKYGDKFLCPGCLYTKEHPPQYENHTRRFETRKPIIKVKSRAGAQRLS